MYVPHSIEALVGAVDGQYRCSSVRLSNSPVTLENDYFGPNLIIYLRPLVQHFLYVFLQNFWGKICDKNKLVGIHHNNYEHYHFQHYKYNTIDI